MIKKNIYLVSLSSLQMVNWEVTQFALRNACNGCYKNVMGFLMKTKIYFLKKREEKCIFFWPEGRYLSRNKLACNCITDNKPYCFEKRLCLNTKTQLQMLRPWIFSLILVYGKDGVWWLKISLCVFHWFHLDPLTNYVIKVFGSPI